MPLCRTAVFEYNRSQLRSWQMVKHSHVVNSCNAFRLCLRSTRTVLIGELAAHAMLLLLLLHQMDSTA
jgi:hypothetical protein